MTSYIIDIEADGLLLDATQVWCLVAKNLETGHVFHAVGPDNISTALQILELSEVIIGHNIIMYDLPVLQRLYNFSTKSKKIDTLLMSRLLFPDRDGGHSLAAWGKRVGLYKGDHKDFSKFSQEMLEYCKNDVEVTHMVYQQLKTELTRYPDVIQQSIEIEHRFAEIINKQVEAGFTLDVVKAEALYNELAVEYNDLYSDLQTKMPKVRKDSHYQEVKKKGLLLSETEKDYTYITEKTKKVTTKEFQHVLANPGSRQQIAEFLIQKGWKPAEFTETGLPKVDEKTLGGLKIPEAKLIARLFRLQKQMGMIKNENGGWLNYVRKDTGRVHGDVHTNATNTGRCSHSSPNLAQVDKKDLRMRDVWIPQSGMVLVGVDAKSLELRLLGHYLSRYDKGSLAFEAVSGDIHTHNKEAMQLNKRDSAKTAIYALVYGAGNKKLGKVVGADREDYTNNEFILAKYGRELRESVEENLIGYKQLVDDVQEAFKTRGYLIGLDGRPLHPRSDYAALNLLIQSAGAIIMKQALINFMELTSTISAKLGVDFNLVANIHDEVQIECKPELAYSLKLLFITAVTKTTEDFNLKCEMGGSGQIGKTWAETH